MGFQSLTTTRCAIAQAKLFIELSDKRREGARMTALPDQDSKPRPPLILASASPRRRELLSGLGVNFTVVVADVTEHEAEDADPRQMVAHNAALKADWVARRHPEALVLGADTTVFIDQTVLNKPRD